MKRFKAAAASAAIDIGFTLILMLGVNVMIRLSSLDAVVAFAIAYALYRHIINPSTTGGPR